MVDVTVYRDSGVVLRVTKLGEADRIITLLTRRGGRVRAVAKGVRRTRSKFGSRLEPFSHVDLQLYAGRNLDIVTQAVTIDPFGPAIAADYARYTTGTAIVETAERLTGEERQPSLRLYLLLVSALRALSEGGRPPGLVLDAFLLRSMALAGWSPALSECARCGEPGPHKVFHVPSGGVLCSGCRSAGSARPSPDALALMVDLAGGNWDGAQAADDPTRREASGLVAALLQWHMERGLRSLPLVDRTESVPGAGSGAPGARRIRRGIRRVEWAAPGWDRSGRTVARCRGCLRTPFGAVDPGRTVKRVVDRPSPHPSGAVPPDIPADAVPRHVALVMDGNGRWARARGLPRTEGHKLGEAALFDVVEGAIELGVRHLSAYAFSTENWKRSPDEVRFLMGFNRDVIRRRRDQMHRLGVRVRWAGRRPRLWRSVVNELEDAEELTAGNDVLTLTMCVNYGGRAEIADAARMIAQEAAAGRINPAKVDERMLARYLDEPDMPDVDLFLRSSGEQRTSNFLLWQSAYAELVFLDTLFPDFDRRDLWRACEIYASRQRRFGAAPS